MNIVADVTKAHLGTIPQLLARIARNLRNYYSVTVLLYEDQVVEMEMVGAIIPNLKTHAISRAVPVPDIVLQLALAAAIEHSFTVVFTFHTSVLRISNSLAPDIRVKVVLSPWGEAVTFLRAGRGDAQPLVADNTVTMSTAADSEAISLLQSVLEAEGAISESTSVKKTQIRQLLAGRDLRFHKGHPASSAPHYISALLEAARQTGLINMTITASNANIWLAKQSPMSSANAPAAQAAQSRTRNLPMVSVARTEAADMRDYKAILKKAGMGPFSNLREDLYDALADEARNSLTLTALIGRVIKTVMEKHVDVKVWGAVRDFLTNSLKRCPVLLDEQGRPISASLRSFRTVVTGVVPNFRVALDAELIMVLLQNGAEVLMEDVPHLTGTLYRTRTEQEDIDKALVAFDYLEAAQRIIRSESSVTLPTSNVTVLKR